MFVFKLKVTAMICFLILLGARDRGHLETGGGQRYIEVPGLSRVHLVYQLLVLETA